MLPRIGRRSGKSPHPRALVAQLGRRHATRRAAQIEPPEQRARAIRDYVPVLVGADHNGRVVTINGPRLGRSHTERQPRSEPELGAEFRPGVKPSDLR